MKTNLTILATFLSVASWAQYTEDLSKVRPMYQYEIAETKQTAPKASPKNTEEKEKISAIAQNAAVENMLDKMAEQNTTAPHNQASGYRIQIYSGDNKNTAEDIKKQLQELDLLENISVYKFFESGFLWRVKVGDFETQLEAYRVYKQLKNKFPTCLLVPERKINLK